MNSKFQSTLAVAFVAVSLNAQSVSTILSGLYEPNGVAIDFANNYYIADGGSGNQIVRWSQDGTVSVFAGKTGEAGFANDIGADAMFKEPWGIVYVPSRGGLVVSDRANQLLRFVDVSTRMVTTLVGQLDPDNGGGFADGAPGVAQFSYPAGLAVDSVGNVYIADMGNQSIRKLAPDNSVSTVISNLNQPMAVALSSDATMWVANAAKNQVIRYMFSGTAWTNTDILGDPQGGYGNVNSSSPTRARFNGPNGLVWIGGQTGLVVSDTGNNALRKISINSSGSFVVSTLTNGFNAPLGLSFDADNSILIADSKSASVKAFTPPSQPNPTISVPNGAYSNALTVSFSTDFSGSHFFRYTTNGFSVGLNSTVGSSVSLDGYATPVQVRSFSPDSATSATVSNFYTFFVDAPAISPTALITNNSVTVNVTEATTNALLYYTLDGSEPSTNSKNSHLIISNSFPLAQTNSGVRIKGFKVGYANSATTVGSFDFFVATPIPTVPAGTYSNDVTVSFSTDTTNATVLWTTDGTDPTLSNGSANPSVTITQNSTTLKARAFRAGFADSAIVSAVYNMVAADPAVSPSGATNNNLVSFTATDVTVGASIRWSTDGFQFTTNTAAVGAPFWVGTNGLLTVKAVRSGYADSRAITVPISLSVAPISVFPLSSTAINTNIITITNATTNAIIHVALTAMDGSGSSDLYFTNLPGTPNYVTITNNETMNVTVSLGGFVPAKVGPLTYQIQVDQPQMSPVGGYFPAGAHVTLSALRPDAQIYYTLAGQSPTTNDLLYTGPIDLNSVQFPKSDLHILSAAAFAPNTIPSAVRAGQSVPSNSVSVASSVIGGAGSTIILPIVVNLQSNKTLQSLQFKMEISPLAGGATANTNYALELVTLSASDYVPVTGSSSEGFTTNFISSTYISGSTNGLTLYVNSGLVINEFGVLANVKVRIPGTAPTNSTYLVNITNVSGTSDGWQTSVPLTSAPGTITVSNYVYLAGDSSPGRWYNAGDFGDDFLDNADVNAAFAASVEIHKPYPGADAFNAMDVYPESGGNASGAGGIIGDGLITYLDWQHILMRSLGRETNSWKRWWESGTLHHKKIDGPNLVRSLRAASPASIVGLPTVNIWLRHALVWGEILTNVAPGNVYSMPIYVKVLPGFELNGLQLRAVMVANDSAPASGAVRFIASDALGQPSNVIQPTSNDVAFAWSLGRSVDPLVSSNLIGYVQFTVPQNALGGQHYTINLKYPEGARDLDTELQLESAAGQVWVLSSPPNPVLHVVSDQWKTNFFGALTNPDADPEADPDHDGIPNWMEYLAGTNPTNADSRLSFSHAERPVDGHGITLRWPAMTGRVYVLESSPTLVGGIWMPVSTNILGDGTLQSFTATDAFDKSRFYRIRLIEQ